MAGLLAPTEDATAARATACCASLGTTRKRCPLSSAVVIPGEVLAYDTMGIPAGAATAIAPSVAPEQAAPMIAATPLSIRVCAEVPA